jgi:hypothetical protein
MAHGWAAGRVAVFRLVFRVSLEVKERFTHLSDPEITVRQVRVAAVVSILLLAGVIGCNKPQPKEAPALGTAAGAGAGAQTHQAKIRASDPLEYYETLMPYQAMKKATVGDTLEWHVDKKDPDATDAQDYYSIDFDDSGICTNSASDGLHAYIGHPATCTLTAAFTKVEGYQINLNSDRAKAAKTPKKKKGPPKHRGGPGPAGVGHCNGCLVSPD